MDIFTCCSFLTSVFFSTGDYEHDRGGCCLADKPLVLSGASLPICCSMCRVGSDFCLNKQELAFWTKFGAILTEAVFDLPCLHL